METDSIRMQETEWQVVEEDGNNVLGCLTKKEAMKYKGKEGIIEIRKVIWRTYPDDHNDGTREDITVWTKADDGITNSEKKCEMWIFDENGEVKKV